MLNDSDQIRAAATSANEQIFIVDDDEAVRDSLEMLLSSVGLKTVCFEFAEQFLQTVVPEQRGCLILDIRMPGMNGLELQEAMLAKGYRIPIIFITGHGDVPMAVRAMKSGAVEFLQKPFKDQDLLICIDKTLMTLAADREEACKAQQHRASFDSLTPREKTVMEMMVAGHANKVIAIDLGISQRTVEIHRSRVMKKMGVRSLAHLVQVALQLTAAQS